MSPENPHDTGLEFAQTETGSGTPTAGVDAAGTKAADTSSKKPSLLRGLIGSVVEVAKGVVNQAITNATSQHPAQPQDESSSLGNRETVKSDPPAHDYQQKIQTLEDQLKEEEAIWNQRLNEQVTRATFAEGELAAAKAALVLKESTIGNARAAFNSLQNINNEQGEEIRTLQAQLKNPLATARQEMAKRLRRWQIATLISLPTTIGIGGIAAYTHYKDPTFLPKIVDTMMSSGKSPDAGTPEPSTSSDTSIPEPTTPTLSTTAPTTAVPTATAPVPAATTIAAIPQDAGAPAPQKEQKNQKERNKDFEKLLQEKGIKATAADFEKLPSYLKSDYMEGMLWTAKGWINIPANHWMKPDPGKNPANTWTVIATMVRESRNIQITKDTNLPRIEQLIPVAGVQDKDNDKITYWKYDWIDLCEEKAHGKKGPTVGNIHLNPGGNTRLAPFLIDTSKVDCQALFPEFFSTLSETEEN